MKSTVDVKCAADGSHCPAASLQQRPVGKQRWLSPRCASDPVHCSPPIRRQLGFWGQGAVGDIAGQNGLDTFVEGLS
jgi:hypothetical protein